MVASMAEIAELAHNQVIPLCFDCSPSGVDNVPPQFVSALDLYLVGFGDASFLAHWRYHDVSKDYELRFTLIDLSMWFVLKTGDVREIQSLSSSTNLHKILNTSGGQDE
jgi:hypothetical protein